MSQTKAQLVAPIGVVTASGVVVSGVMTAATFDGDIVGSATSIIQGTNLNVGAFNATSFAGDFTGNATGIITSSAIKVGQLTASSFVGDFTGTATSMMRGTGFEAGAVTASSFVANVTGNVTGNATGLAGSVTQGTNIHVGVVTATSLFGDGSNLTGIAATNYNTQTVTANGAATNIDLSAGNVITFNQSANTTVSFANTSEAMDVTLIRVKDASNTARTISWPSSIKWNGGVAPTLITDKQANDIQQFQFITRDSGVTWYAWENYKRDEDIQEVWLWGGNDQGQLGQNQGPAQLDSRSSPIQLPGTTWSQVCWSGFHDVGIMGLKTDGSLWGWGLASNGRLGLNDNIQYSSPTQVGTDTTWASFYLGKDQAAAVKTDGTFWMWGENAYGQLGQNNTNPGYSSPIQLGSDTDWDSGVGKYIAVQRKYLAIKTNGELWGWGSNNGGQMGVNVKGPSTSYYSSPIQIPGTTWNKVISGTGVIKTDGSLWVIGGGGGSGAPGQNDRTNRSSPVQVPGTWSTGASQLLNGGFFGIKTDGTMWSWGYNETGGMAQNTSKAGGVHSYSSPTQIGTGSDWSSVVRGMRGGSALKTDGTMWVWGANSYGSLGINQPSPSSRSSPTQVSGTWSALIEGGWGQRGGFKKPY